MRNDGPSAALGSRNRAHASARSSGRRMLPGAAFTDPDVLEWERANLFRGGWVCAGHVDQVRERGQYLMVEVGGESVLVVADDDGLPRAFLNTCRHRGARLVIMPEGTVRRLQCPYHAWTYGLDGTLRSAPFTDGLEDFDQSCFGLHQVRLAVVEGLDPARPVRRGAVAAGARRRSGDPPRRVPDLRAAARAARRLRRRSQLEGDRRELQRVPALPGRAPGAQPPLPLPLGRDATRAQARGAAAR